MLKKRRERGIAKTVPNCCVIVDLQMLAETSQTTLLEVQFTASTTLNIGNQVHMPD